MVGGAQIFISYRRGHERSLALLASLRHKLSEAGYQVLVDDTIEGGEAWPSALYDWLLNCAGAVILASPEAAASDWCRREWEVLAARATIGRARVVPVLVGLETHKLGALDRLQAIRDDGDAERISAAVLAAVGSIEPWKIGADDVFALHAAWVRWQFREAPILGQEPFSLQSVYIETDCVLHRWEELSSSDSRRRRDPFDTEQPGERRPLLDEVLRLLAQPSSKAGEREVIVVQGPAGSGKSAFTLRLADRLLELGLQPMLVRFRDMRLASHSTVEELLEDALRVGPESEPAKVPTTALLGDERLRISAQLGGTAIARVVIILDGWDEVSLAGSAGYQAQLQTWLPRFRDFFVKHPRVPPVRLLVTGRPSLEVKESGFLWKQTPILTLLPMRPEQLEHFAGALNAHWHPERRPPAVMFERYRAWYEKRKTGGVEMLGQPLLAFLAVRALGRHDGDPGELLAAPSALYKALIDETTPGAGKVEASLEGTVHKGGSKLRSLLQKTAAIISIFWSERLSFDELSSRFENEMILEEWVDAATSENPLHALVVNFWFKGGNRDLGCEFLHKSFREYLFAEAILSALLELGKGRSGPLAPLDLPFWQDFPPDSLHWRASRRISELFAPQWLTLEVRTHLFWLVRTAIEEDRERWLFLRDLLTDVYGWWAEGVHLRRQPRRVRASIELGTPYVDDLVAWSMPYTDPTAEPMRTTTLDAHLGDALMQLTAFVYWCLDSTPLGDTLEPMPGRPYQARAPQGEERRFAPGRCQYFSPLVARIDAAGLRRPGGRGISGSFLAGVVLDNEVLDGLSAVQPNLCGASLRAASLAYAVMVFAQFVGTRFGEPTRDPSLQFFRAELTGSDLRNADLSGVDLSTAWLDGVKLEGVKRRPDDPPIATRRARR